MAKQKIKKNCSSHTRVIPLIHCYKILHVSSGQTQNKSTYTQLQIYSNSQQTQSNALEKKNNHFVLVFHTLRCMINGLLYFFPAAYREQNKKKTNAFHHLFHICLKHLQYFCCCNSTFSP